jgi:hypothetical protein
MRSQISEAQWVITLNLLYGALLSRQNYNCSIRA